MFNKKRLHPQQGLKRVAVVVPLSNRSEFTPDEEISLRHLMHYLGRYDKYFVIPDTLKINFDGFRLKPFDKKYFGSLAAHSKLMLSPVFYKAFSEYEYILIYHLDALVFSDQLTEWCSAGFDYIGSPWIKYDGAPYSGKSDLENKVGNGGFSLRKIESFLKVIYSRKYSIEPREYWGKKYAMRGKFVQLTNIHKKFLKYISPFNNARWEISRYPYTEEPFWVNRASHYYPEFNIAPLEVALRFAFECGPRLCFEKTNQQLPFGCHAWQKYDREFWEPYLLT